MSACKRPATEAARAATRREKPRPEWANCYQVVWETSAIRLARELRHRMPEAAMHRLIGRALVFVPAATGTLMWGLPAWLVVSVAGATAGAAWWLGRCHHPRPLGLVPPTTDREGQRRPARWFCGECGRYFSADFDRERGPVLRFPGYDESKARVAAKRAADLTDRQRQLAVRRAGMDQRVPPAPRPQPLPVNNRRRAG